MPLDRGSRPHTESQAWFHMTWGAENHPESSQLLGSLTRQEGLGSRVEMWVGKFPQVILMYNPVLASAWQRLCWELLEAHHHPPGGDLHVEHRTARVEAPPRHTPGIPMVP